MATAFASTDLIAAYAYGAPNVIEALKEFTMPSSYPTGGIDLSTACAEFTEVIEVRASNVVTGSTPWGFTFRLTGTAGTYGVTVATAKLAMGWGKDTAAAGGTNIPFIEVDNTTDLTVTLTTVRATVRGYKA